MYIRLYYILFGLLIALCQESRTQHFARGCILDSIAYEEIPLSTTQAPRQLRSFFDDLPPYASLKSFSQRPGNQDKFTTCTSWAVAYGLNILEGRMLRLSTDTRRKKDLFAPAYLHRKALNGGDSHCQYGIRIAQVLNIARTMGCVRFADLPRQNLCLDSDLPLSTETQAKGQIVLHSYARLWKYGDMGDQKVNPVKLSLSHGFPVVIAINAPASFHTMKSMWKPEPNEPISRDSHAICVIGYDDDHGGGGAFEIINSWGEDWGEKGYGWIRYEDFAKYVKEGYELRPVIRNEQVKLAAQIELELMKYDSNSQVDHPLEVQLISAAGDQLTVYEVLKPLVDGDRFRIHISNMSPAFINAFWGGIEMETQSLLALKSKYNPNFPSLSPEIYIPEQSAILEWSRETGEEEYLLIILSENPLNDNADDLATLWTPKFKRQRFEELVESSIVKNKWMMKHHAEQIKFERKRISFECPISGIPIIPILIKFKP